MKAPLNEALLVQGDGCERFESPKDAKNAVTEDGERKREGERVSRTVRFSLNASDRASATRCRAGGSLPLITSEQCLSTELKWSAGCKPRAATSLIKAISLELLRGSAESLMGTHGVVEHARGELISD